MVAAMNEVLSSTVATNICSTTARINTNNLPNIPRDKSDILASGDAGTKTRRASGYPCDFDHIYASMSDTNTPGSAALGLGVSPLGGNELRQSDASEVKHLKELLLLHLDLIQQQSEQIVTKEKLLTALRQENETLKLRLERIDRRVNLQKLRPENTENLADCTGSCSSSAFDLTGIPSTTDEDHEIVEETVRTHYNETFKIRLNTAGSVTTMKHEISDHDCKHDSSGELSLGWLNNKKRTSSSPASRSTKRKRGGSSSSNISNDTSSTIQDTSTMIPEAKKSEKKDKSSIKKESFLTTDEHYYTAIGDTTYCLNLLEAAARNDQVSLEVPSWRIKAYTSCYTMEGTENLDDEIFNKRHLKLENDERRRKRWDFQRIREQRHIEKLRQRQERQNHHASCYNTNHNGPCQPFIDGDSVPTLWPDLDHIQSIQVEDILPICAFGDFIPGFTPSGFFLPWLVNKAKSRRRPKRLASVRKSSRR